MEVQERKEVKMPSKSKSSKRRRSSSSEPKTNSKPQSIPAASNPNGDPPSSPTPRKNPNPNPNSKSSKRPKPSRSSPILPKSSKAPKSDAVTPDDTSADPASPSRKSDRKRKASDFSDDEPGTTNGGKGSPAVQRRLADDNAVALLRAVIDFRSRTGSIPVSSNMATFYDFVKASLPTPLTKEQVYNKLRHLRHKFQKAGPLGSGPNDGLVHDLCTEVWGAEDKKDDNKVEKVKKGTPVPAIKNGDAALEAAEEKEQQQEEEREEERDGEERGVDRLDSLPYVSSAAAEHWKANGLWGVSWEAGLKRMDPSKARALEEKWRRQLGDEMKFQLDWSKTSRELLVLLNDSFKSTSA